MRSLSIIYLSMLVWFCQATFLQLPQINIPFVRPSYGMMLNAAHITITCVLSCLLFRTLQELKQIKTNIAHEKQEKSKIKGKKFVTESQLENRFEEEINEKLDQKAAIHAKQAGRFFTTVGEGGAIKDQLQEYYGDLVKLQTRVENLEQENSNLKQQLTLLSKSEQTT